PGRNRRASADRARPASRADHRRLRGGRRRHLVRDDAVVETTAARTRGAARADRRGVLADRRRGPGAAAGADGRAASARTRVRASSQLDQMFRNRAVAEQLGPFGYHAYDAWSYVRGTLLRPAVTEAQIADARAWFAGRTPLRAAAGPFFGAARGKNLIVIQVESLQD